MVVIYQVVSCLVFSIEERFVGLEKNCEDELAPKDTSFRARIQISSMARLGAPGCRRPASFFDASLSHKSCRLSHSTAVSNRQTSSQNKPTRDWAFFFKLPGNDPPLVSSLFLVGVFLAVVSNVLRCWHFFGES